MSAVGPTTFEYVTASVIDDFSGAGIQNLLAATQTPDISEEALCEIVSEVFTELLMAVQLGQLAVVKVVDFLKLAIIDEQRASLFCQVFDVFPRNDSMKNLLNLLCKEEYVIKTSTLANFVDFESLISLGILPAQPLNRQMNTKKRDEYFTQKKFNLLHEEYEGYSALLVELHFFLNNKNNIYMVDNLVYVVESLIGHYLLDPNRVLDIIIDVSSHYVLGNHRFIMAFLKKSLWWPQEESRSHSGIEDLQYGGSRTAVNSIALKLAKYSINGEIPETLRLLISVFVSEGFISFGQLYPHICPPTNDMEILEATYLAELGERVVLASASALALAAPLTDEAEESKTDASVTSSVATRANVKRNTVKDIVKENLLIQMLKTFLSIGLYWPSIYVISNFPFLVHADSEVSELMHRMLGQIITPLFESNSTFQSDELCEFQENRNMAYSRIHNKVKSEEFSVKSRYVSKPNVRPFSKPNLVFFYSEWSEKLPKICSADELIDIAREFIKFFDVALARDPSNFIKICDIIVWDLNRDHSAPVICKWFEFFRNYLLTSICLIGENAIPVEKAYGILKFFSPDERFNLYGELYQVISKNNSHVKIAYGKAEKATRDVLKRLSKENVEPMMRRLAKISISNPLPCFLTILQQLESYDNLNTLVVETAGFINEYGWDNLTLAIMLRLTAGGRSSKQANGLNERQWMQSLSSFIGKICQKYPKCVDLQILIKYLISSFHTTGSTDLIVFKEMLSFMGGIQAVTNLTQLQINMINSGKSLEKIVYKVINDQRYNSAESASELMMSLGKQDLVNETFVMLCKLGDDLISSHDISHLKVMAQRKDELDSVLHLYCTLVGFDSAEPPYLLPLCQLIKEYKVPVPWAFEFHRARTSIANLDQIVSSIKDDFSQGIFDKISPKVFVIFWISKLYDINYSAELYDSEKEKMNSKVLGIKEEISIARRDKKVGQDIVDKLKSSMSEIEELMANIPKEKKMHEDHNIFFESCLMTNFTECSGSVFFDAGEFLQRCVLPRAVHSCFDATYSSSFLFKLHKLTVPSFSILEALDHLFKQKIVFVTLFTCTPTEAENLGIFLSVTLKELNNWMTLNLFENEAANGHLKDGAQSTQLSFEEFRKRVFEYHSVLLEDVSRALQVTTYMSRMNAITFLKNLLGVYPIVEDHCEKIISLINDISSNDKRDDLKLSSNALVGHVKSRQNKWVHMWDFMEMDKDAMELQKQQRKLVEDKANKETQTDKRSKATIDDSGSISRAGMQKHDPRGSPRPKTNMHVVSYDDAITPKSRDVSRLSKAPKGRYDQYFNPPSVPSSNKESATSSVDQKMSIKSESSVHKPSYASRAAKSDYFSSTYKGREGKDKSEENFNSSKDDLYKSRMERKDPKGSTSSTNSQLKARLEEARNDFRTRNERKDVDPNPTNGGNTRSSTPAFRSVSPREDISSQSSKKSYSSAKFEPSTRSRVQHASPSYSGSSGSRGKESISSVRTQSMRTPLPPRSTIRDNSSSSQDRQTTRAPLPPQSTLRSRAPLPPPSVPRGFRNESNKNDRFQIEKTNGVKRRSSGDPLPPPSLPPPSRNHNPGDRDNRYKKQKQ